MARTIIDLARADRRQGIVAADAVRERLVSRDQLAVVLVHCVRCPGVAAAREVVGLASRLAESPLESLIRLCLRDGGPPELQVWVSDPADGWRCRVDMMWRRSRTHAASAGCRDFTARLTKNRARNWPVGP